MRKTFIVAVREYMVSVRTKAFLIGLLMMPLMMGGSQGINDWYLDRDTSR